MYGGGWHRTGRYGSTGCCGTFFGGIILILMIFFMVWVTDDTGTNVTYDDFGYNEELFQDFANEQYEAEFGRSSAYEDNLLITVLTCDDYYNFYYIAWVGDHIDYEINSLLGNNDTTLGRAMNNCISSTNYKYSLDSDLARVMMTMSAEIQALGLNSSYTCTEDHSQVQSHLTNRTGLDMTTATVNDALTAFTDATGIPVVIVVEDVEEVFGSEPSRENSRSPEASAVPWKNVVVLAVMGVVLVAAVVFAVKAVRRKNEQLD